MKTSNEVESSKRPGSSYGFLLIILLAWMLFPFGQSACFAGTLTFAWDANTEPDLAGYKLYYGTDAGLPLNGTGAAEGNSPIDVQKLVNTTVTGLDPNKTYYFAVTAYNNSGIESSYSNILTVSGSNSLTTAVTAPLNNTTVSGAVSVTASASDPVGVVKVEFYVNGVLQATDTATPYLFSWNSATLASGSYTLMTRAYSSSGNAVQSGNVVVSVTNDTTAPAVSLTSPGTGTTVSGTVTITAAASDNVGVSKVELYSNGALLYAGNMGPYSYGWNTSSLANGSYTLTAKAYDNTGNVGQSAAVTVTVSNGDATAPTVTAFTIPTSASSTTVSVTSLTATDNLLVTGYMITESATVPSASAAGWSSNAPASFTFSSTGTKTAYAWAKDASGNVSSSRSASVRIALPTSDITVPVVTAFVMPVTATSLTVAVNSFTATDNVGVTGYMITESVLAPAATAAGWSSTAPASFTFSSTGSKTAHAWAKDASGNVSSSRSASVNIALPTSDIAAPAVTTFVMPTTATSLTVAVSSFTATDNVGVTGYMITESFVAPSVTAAGWNQSVPASFTFSAPGSRFVASWAKDAAGNVSSGRIVFVTVTLDGAPPVINTFGIPATSTSLTVPVSTFTATDAVGVTGYMITESTVAPLASTSGWSAVVPASFTFAAAGSRTAYAWTRDAAGNVSASRSGTVSITLPATALTISDALSALQAVAGSMQLTGAQKSRLDVAPFISGNSQPDGKVDLSDVIVILGKLTGKVVL